MKRKKLFLLMIAFLLNSAAFSKSNFSDAACICLSNSFKILSDDGKFTNMTMIPNHGAIIIGSGTYRQTAPNAYTEHVEKNLHLPQLVGVDNILEFEMKGGDVMVLKFFVKTDKDGNEINSWYYETWKRVKMPPVYPKDLVR